MEMVSRGFSTRAGMTRTHYYTKFTLYYLEYNLEDIQLLNEIHQIE